MKKIFLTIGLISSISINALANDPPPPVYQGVLQDIDGHTSNIDANVKAIKDYLVPKKGSSTDISPSSNPDAKGALTDINVNNYKSMLEQTIDDLLSPSKDPTGTPTYFNDPIILAYSNHSKYCNLQSSDSRLYPCNSFGANNPPDADIMANILLDNDNLAQATIDGNNTIDLQDAAKSFLSNINIHTINSELQDMLKKATSNEGKYDNNSLYKNLVYADQTKLGNMLISQAQSSIPEYSFKQMLNSRIPVQAIGKSEMEAMADEAESRFALVYNSDWLKDVDKATSITIMRELVKMQAYHNWLQYKQYKQAERTEALLALMVSYMTQMGGKMNI